MPDVVSEDFNEDFNIDPEEDRGAPHFLQVRISATTRIRADAEVLDEGESPVPESAAFETVQGDREQDQTEGFGVVRYEEGFVSIVGESSEIDYGSCEVVCKANSVDGTFEFAEELNKYARVEVDITNPGFSNTGLPHWVLEDTFEWINAGAPSHLAQVYHSNIANFGIAFERSNPGHLEAKAPPYQARFYAACSRDWYDWKNSTVDFEEIEDTGNMGLMLPYPNALVYLPSLGQVWVGGQGALLAIDTSTLAITGVNIDPRRTLFIRDIFATSDSLYILDEKALYIMDLGMGETKKDAGLGLPDVLHKVVRMSSGHLIIGGSDGIYARKPTQDEWQKVASTSAPANIMIAPEACFSVAGSEIWYTSEGFTWTKIGTITDKIINQIAKHRSQIVVATSEGLYGDGGSFYSGSVSLSLMDILNDLEASSGAVVNAVASNFNTLVAGLSDGRYVVYETEFEVFDDSLLSAVHKVLLVEDDIWLFGYDTFRLRSEAFVRRLATGEILK